MSLFNSFVSIASDTDIHAVMIQDTVRTSSSASFILTNSTLFRDATVLDVGCGTGILSLFAAKAGAKHVIAVDASDITKRTEKVVSDNKMNDIITYVPSCFCSESFHGYMFQSYPWQSGGDHTS
ncbi:MAG TPA: 50S ribosomal protein L11 methyltransferase [Chlamydiales bacterium]|nr:50S ribosomal protein L11 methyltransferase [Chlamydiales bacterium]